MHQKLYDPWISYDAFLYNFKPVTRELCQMILRLTDLHELGSFYYITIHLACNVFNNDNLVNIKIADMLHVMYFRIAFAGLFFAAAISTVSGRDQSGVKATSI